MGQYHILVNLTKKQFVHPHRIGNGLKLREQVGWECSTATALVMLLASSNGRGGGDFHSSSSLVGSWAGDSVAFVGDYAESDDLAGVDAPTVYNQCDSGKFKDISDKVREMMAEEFDVHYKGEPDSWLKVVKGPAPKKGWVENNPLVCFGYPSSRTGQVVHRTVRVISANDTYVVGLDTYDKNRFKKFRRNRIVYWQHNKPFGNFSPESI